MCIRYQWIISFLWDVALFVLCRPRHLRKVGSLSIILLKTSTVLHCISRGCPSKPDTGTFQLLSTLPSRKVSRNLRKHASRHESFVRIDCNVGDVRNTIHASARAGARVLSTKPYPSGCDCMFFKFSNLSEILSCYEASAGPYQRRRIDNHARHRREKREQWRNVYDSRNLTVVDDKLQTT